MTTPRSGEHERRLAVGTVAQQGAQAVAFLSMLAVITVLGRRLSLAEFGTYGLFASLSTYTLVAQVSVESATVKLLAPAVGDDAETGRIASTAFALYGLAGLVVGLVVVAAGLGLPGPLGVERAFRGDVALASLLTAVAMALGWPLRVYRDALRSANLFRRAAAADAMGYLAMTAVSVALALGGGPLWALIAVVSMVPGLTGLASLVLVRRAGLAVPTGRGHVDRATARVLSRLAGNLLLASLTDFVVYGLDRIVLAAFRSPATVALYEGPVRAHNLVRVVTGALGFTVLPAAAQYQAAGDVARTRDLFVRGTRYVLALVVPIAVTLMALAGPLLEVWLGPRFVAGQAALVILVGYWLLNANTIVAAGMLVAHGHTRWLAGYAWVGAAISLTLSVVLTGPLGLTGVALGTTLTYVMLFPVFIRFTLATLGVGLGELARQAWLPAYSVAGLLVGALIALRLVATPDTVVAVVTAGLAAVGGYWAVYWVVWLRPSERRLVGDVVRGMLRAG